jgi:hypothetical protein
MQNAIELKKPETQRAIEYFFCKSGNLAKAKEAFLNDWARAGSQKQAIEISKSMRYDGRIASSKALVDLAFNKMTDAIKSEIADYPFQSTEWSFK